ncbi:MAG: prephenate dehydrogenase/arogenate dehydrogenase family protein [Candidatus Omnitrophica bacterium]|nr:prephenate dehydrogenase/arogenate dehydrogenase family protein [Candidatus Omnitrophota bacterium]
MHFGKITIVGVGLLGGSLGLAIKQRGLAGKVTGYVRRSESADECMRQGVADEVTLELPCAVEGSDLVILCTPIAQMRDLTERMLPYLKPGVLVTDVGSVKGKVVLELEPLVARARGRFIGSHPMAGAEKMGVRAARADLFERALCILTPTPATPLEATRNLDGFWRGIGARSLILSPELHDELVSRSSHLPHIIAAELANYVLSPLHPKEQSLLCANGFRDTTRIASGSPEMWRDIVLANRKNLLRVLGIFIEDLQEFRVALEREEPGVLTEFFEQAKQRRDAWSAQSNSPE